MAEVIFKYEVNIANRYQYAQFPILYVSPQNKQFLPLALIDQYIRTVGVGQLVLAHIYVWDYTTFFHTRYDRLLL
jgi:hypothetical protein